MLEKETTDIINADTLNMMKALFPQLEDDVLRENIKAGRDWAEKIYRNLYNQDGRCDYPGYEGL